MRVADRTRTVECLAPTAVAAGYVVARAAFGDREVPWVQVVASEWSGILGEFVEPRNALVFTPDDPEPEGAAHVVMIAVAAYGQ